MVVMNYFLTAIFSLRRISQIDSEKKNVGTSVDLAFSRMNGVCSEIHSFIHSLHRQWIKRNPFAVKKIRWKRKEKKTNECERKKTFYIQQNGTRFR